MLGHRNFSATSQDKGCSCRNVKAERLVPTPVLQLSTASWPEAEYVDMSSWSMAVRSSGVSFILRAKREAICASSYTPSYDTLNDIRHFYNLINFQILAVFSIILHPEASTLYNSSIKFRIEDKPSAPMLSDGTGGQQVLCWILMMAWSSVERAVTSKIFTSIRPFQITYDHGYLDTLDMKQMALQSWYCSVSIWLFWQPCLLPKILHGLWPKINPKIGLPKTTNHVFHLNSNFNHTWLAKRRDHLLFQLHTIIISKPELLQNSKWLGCYR